MLELQELYNFEDVGMAIANGKPVFVIQKCEKETDIYDRFTINCK